MSVWEEDRLSSLWGIASTFSMIVYLFHVNEHPEMNDHLMVWGFADLFEF
jgi:hypothetical protein